VECEPFDAGLGRAALTGASPTATTFRPGDPHGGYYFDLRPKALVQGPGPEDGMRQMARLTGSRARAYPVDVVQLGLGAWQLGLGWAPVVAATADWLVSQMDADGRIPCLFPMPHTFSLPAPWHSSLAQGETASLLVRTAVTLERPELRTFADLAVRSLLDPTLGLIATTPDGPVLQEYPTHPPSHVLNGWITSLWGLYDVSRAVGGDPAVSAAAAAAFDEGVRCLSRRLHLYRLALGWSRYDLYPHALVNVASPMYQRLHVGHLEALARLVPDPVFSGIAAEWRSAARRPPARTLALARKIAFRLVFPRGRLWQALRRLPRG
jgi:hypothetical protein